MKGTIRSPISLESQNQDGQQDLQANLERARRKELLDEAKMSRNPIQLALAVIKTTIKGQLSVKNKTLNRAVIKFFYSRLGINISCEHFHPRKEPEYENNPINPKQFLLYGVDFLTTAMIQDRFKLIDTSIEQIIWINSSTCKIIYKTQSEARLVLQSQVFDKRTLQFKIDEEAEGHLQGWFTLKPYHFLNFQRHLIMRYSTEAENSIPKEQMNKYKEYESAYAELLPTLFNEFKAYQQFQKVVREVQCQRNDYHRNRRYQNNFGKREGSRERSRTRDKKYQRNNRNQNSQQRDRNTSFAFRKKNDSFFSKNGNMNDINTSFQMRRGVEAYRNRQDSNVFNTSFEMRPADQNRNENGRNQRRNRNWQRNNNNRQRPNASANEFEANVIRQVEYQHRPVEERHMSQGQNRNQKYLNPPRKNNVYYDCNDIEEELDLSYQFLPQREESHQESDNLEDISFKFNSKPQKNNDKSKQMDKLQLSYIVNKLNNSKEDYTNKNVDSSFRFNQSNNSLNKSINQDMSFILNDSKIIDKPAQQKDKVDFTQLFKLNQDISPIHQQVLDTSFDFKKQQKSRPPLRTHIIDDDDGY